MTEEIFGSVWQNDVVALAIENSDIDLTVPGTEALIVRAVFGGNVASQRKDNSNFTFTVLDSGETYATVAEETGIVTAASAGTATIEVTLTGYANVPPAYAQVTVTGG